MRRVLPAIVLLFVPLSGAAGLAQDAPNRTRQPAPADAKADASKSDPKSDSKDAPPEEELSSLPKRSDLSIPTVEQLVKGPALDWLVLIGEHVLIVEPVDPRPGTLEHLQQKIKAAKPKFAGRETEDEKAARLALNYLTITLPDEKEQDYKIPIQYIHEVVHWEDLMLKRIDLLLDEQDIREALQLLLVLERRQRNWPGSIDRQKRVLFVDASVRLSAGRAEESLALLEDLFRRDAQYPDLGKLAGEVVDRLVADSLKADDYRRARHFLKRLRSIEAEHVVAKRLTNDLLEQARGEMSQALTAEKAGQPEPASSHIEAAARIWPDTPDLATAHRRIADRYQRLRVGVWELPSTGKPNGSAPVSREADRRRQTLVELPLFRPDRTDKTLVRFEAPFLQGWEPTDLGHSLQLQLRTHRERWQSRPPVTVGDVALAIAARLDPQNPQYDERLATFVDSVSIRSPTELSVRFQLVPLRPEALFRFPVSVRPLATEPEVPADEDGVEKSPDTSSDGPVRTWPFHEKFRDERRVVFARTEPEPPLPADWHVAEIAEVLYDSPEKAIQGLLRGEVHLLPRAPAWTVSALEARNDYYVLPYDQTESHVLHFRPESRLVAGRGLRRALVYALNRSQLLRDVFLKDAPETYGRVTSGLVPSASYAYNPAVTPHKHDPALALSLLPAVKKEFEGKLPSITLSHPSDPSIAEAARRIAEAWKRLGISVILVAEGAPDWDVAYRVVSLSEPLVELWPAITFPHGNDVASLRPVAPWLREQLLALDQAGDFSLSQTLLHRIHSQLWAEVQVIPLWELQPVMIARKNIRGLPNRPIVTYDDVEKWKIEPWYTRE